MTMKGQRKPEANSEGKLAQELACLKEGIERLAIERLVNAGNARKRHEEVLALLNTLAGGRPQPIRGKLNDLEGKIVDALSKDTLIGEEIAERLGQDDCDGHLKGTVSSMVKRGVLGNRRPGYYVRRQSHDQG